MKKSHFGEEQIIAFLKQQEGGVPTAWDQLSHLLQMEFEV